MTTNEFFHGIKTENKASPPAIALPQTGVIAIFGTAKNGEAKSYNPYVFRTPEEAIRLFGDPTTDTTSTLPRHLATIFELGRPLVIAIKATEEELKKITTTPAVTNPPVNPGEENPGEENPGEENPGEENPRDDIADDDNNVENISGSYDAVSDKWSGIESLRLAVTSGYIPDIYIAPYFTQNMKNAEKLIDIAHKNLASFFVDMPNTTKQKAKERAAILGLDEFRDSCGLGVYPAVKRKFGNSEVEVFGSAIYAAITASLDYWRSPSNKLVDRVVDGLSKSVTWTEDVVSSDANDLNAAKVATFINDEGWRTWGNRSLASMTSEYSFYSVRRTDLTMQRAFKRFVRYAQDEAIGKALPSEIVSRANLFFREQRRIGAILGGEAEFSREENTAAGIKDGKTRFRMRYTPVYPNEAMTLGFEITERFLEEIIDV